MTVFICRHLAWAWSQPLLSVTGGGRGVGVGDSMTSCSQMTRRWKSLQIKSASFPGGLSSTRPPGFTFLVLFFPWSALKSRSQSWLLGWGEKKKQVWFQNSHNQMFHFSGKGGLPHVPLRNVFPTHCPPHPPFLPSPRGGNLAFPWAFSPVDPCVLPLTLSRRRLFVHLSTSWLEFELFDCREGLLLIWCPHYMAPERLTEAQWNQCCGSIRRSPPPNCICLDAEFHWDAAWLATEEMETCGLKPRAGFRRGPHLCCVCSYRFQKRGLTPALGPSWRGGRWSERTASNSCLLYSSRCSRTVLRWLQIRVWS